MLNQPEYPEYQSFNCLSDEQAESLKAAYKAYVENPVNTNTINLFKNGSDFLKGYIMTLSDYTAMISFPGVSIWKLRFAYEQGQQNNMLQFLLVGCTAHGIPMTPHFQLKNRLMENISNAPPLTPEYKVPSTLMYPWENAYTALIREDNIPPTLLQSPWSSGNTLHGYNFDFSDFLDVLYNNDEGVLPANSIVELRIMNHAEYRGGSIQHVLPGMIGVAITVMEPNNVVPQGGLAYYDISKPCPPTC